jgi:hypothetical protein
MSSQKSKNNSRNSKVSTALENKKSKDRKPDSHSDVESKRQIKFKKVKKISRSIRRIESEISNMQTKLQNIENDLNTILKFIENGKKR